MADNVDGSCHADFGALAKAFSDNFDERGELGAAVCVIVGGEVVCDLWGGWADPSRSRPWRETSIVDYYSAGKPIVATLLLRLIDRGLIDLDGPIATYWPEFGVKGKESATVRDALCHRAGVPAIRRNLSDEDLWNWDTMVEALADSEPWFAPGSRHVYHTNTYGHLIGELVRRVDGRHPSVVLAELAQSIDADIMVSVPPEQLARCADVLLDSNRSPATLPPDDGDEGSMILRGYFNPPGYSSFGVVNSVEWRRAEVPSTNGHGSARGLSRFYHCLIDGRLLEAKTLAAASSAQSVGPCPVLGEVVSFGLGFQPTTPRRPFAPGSSSFGHFGTGGAVGFADPSRGVAFGYVMNHVIPRWQSTRNRALIDALYLSLG
jgi:CubicO group peptidase (beta-lactamase class C family)